MKKQHFMFCLLLISFFKHYYSQDNTIIPNSDGVFNKENISSKRYIPYTNLREGDVAWQKRIWRDIDMREKQNQPLYYPIEPSASRTSLFQAITKQILTNKLTAYDDEEFLIPYETSAIRNKLIKIDTIEREIFNPNGESYFERVEVIDSTSIYARVLKFRLIEDWFFDKQKSSLEVRIIGLAAYEYLEDKNLYGYPIFTH